MRADTRAKLAKSLRSEVSGSVVVDEPLSRHTTLRVGGPAGLLVAADTLRDLKTTLDLCSSHSVPWFVIGKGSNLLVSDAGYDGVMIQLGVDFRKIKRTEEGLQAGAAAALPLLVQAALREELGGLAFAVGIPGTVGGAIAGNAGAHGACIGDRISSVTLLDSCGTLRHCNRSELRFTYRASSIESDQVIVEALLVLQAADPAKIRGEMERNFKRRKQTQPTGLPSAGSVFKNPGRQSAGKLIEDAGLKGMSVGDAQISLRHANYLVNRGSARAADVFALIRTVQQRVHATSGIRLEPEVRFVGDFAVDQSEVETNFAR